MSKIFLTSDTHFYHDKIIELDERPFNSMRDMIESLICNWNDLVNKSDTVYHLGDFSFGNRDQNESILSRLNGQKVLIIGNHDRNQVYNAKGWSYNPIHYRKIKYKEKTICMSHFPFLTWDKIGKGSLMAHGHCHGNIPDDLERGKTLDVGIMNHNYKPLFIDDFIDMADSKKIITIDYH